MLPVLKAILAGLLLLAAAAATGSRLLLEGRVVPARRSDWLRSMHVWAGWSFAGLLLILTGLGFVLAAQAGPAVPPWAVLHGHLALALDALLLAKIGLLKAFPVLRRFVPGLGLLAAGTALVVVLGGLGFGILAGPGAKAPMAGRGSEEIAQDPEAEAGREMFTGLCAGCHSTGRNAAGGGLGLEGLFKRTTLPVSGRPATEEGVRLQLRRPFRSMPAFSGLSEAEMAALLVYLRRL